MIGRIVFSIEKLLTIHGEGASIEARVDGIAKPILGKDIVVGYLSSMPRQLSVLSKEQQCEVIKTIGGKRTVAIRTLGGITKLSIYPMRSPVKSFLGAAERYERIEKATLSCLLFDAFTEADLQKLKSADVKMWGEVELKEVEESVVKALQAIAALCCAHRANYLYQVAMFHFGKLDTLSGQKNLKQSYALFCRYMNSENDDPSVAAALELSYRRAVVCLNVIQLDVLGISPCSPDEFEGAIVEGYDQACKNFAIDSCEKRAYFICEIFNRMNRLIRQMNERRCFAHMAFISTLQEAPD